MSTDQRPRVLPQAVLDAMPGAVAQLGRAGEILGVNALWRALSVSGHLGPSTNVMTGANLIEQCDRVAADGVTVARALGEAIRGVLAGDGDPPTLEEFIVTRLEGEGYDGALVTHVDSTGIVGLQARRLAHEFNNQLTVVIGYAEMLHTTGELPAAFRGPVAEILIAARRATELTERILALTGKQS